MKRYIYFFGEKGKEAKNLLGGKGANLGEMKKIGLPVPHGFTITTEACREYYKNGGKINKDIWEQIKDGMKKIEKITGKKFGSSPVLLVSVRSGAPISMPGMMDTILNLGLNDETVIELGKQSKNERFAYDSYRRLIQMFGNVVFGIPHEEFENKLEEIKAGREDTDIDVDELKIIVEEFKKIIRNHAHIFPQDVYEQLRYAISSVFKSWNNKRAITYRKLHEISDDLGTAVNVQEMVFGNLGWDSATGVGFTRNPSTGEKEYYGEYLLNAQGEDVVAGIRTPKPLKELEKDMPNVFEELKKVYRVLEKHYKDMQDFEFTIERGKLYILQTRTGKRTMKAAVKIAVDMVKEGIIRREDAIMRIDAKNINQLLHPTIKEGQKLNIITRGIGASPGAATGIVIFSSEKAALLSEDEGMDVILVRRETSPEDIHGMAASKGILTARGGQTSHAAVVARAMGKPCIVGCESINIDEKNGIFSVNGIVVKEGEWITIDGDNGNVILGKVELVEPMISKELLEILKWSDQIKKLGVRANADTPKDAKIARNFGAEGIGLCRTEHMFFEKDRIGIMQKAIMSKSNEAKKYLDKLFEFQEKDFYEIFKVMNGLPVTIRLLDPPLHEFLPSYEELLVEIEKIKMMGKRDVEKERILKRVAELKEFNPMLGNRGCRLGITFPEIYEMQVCAIISAACRARKDGMNVKPEIMVPLVSDVKELILIRNLIERVAKDVMEKNGIKIEYKIGTMIELPRAALTAHKIAKYADFFSFGTNDLTQTTYGFSRDDAEGKFLKKYKELNIIDFDPFMRIDEDGVGELVKIGSIRGKKGNKKLKIGICGEHGGEYKSIEFFNRLPIDYVSCSPYRIITARIASAQAQIKKK